jgi:hypothetical protein
MSIFDIRSIVTLSQPLPNKVWAAICAIVLLAIVWRALARAPEPVRRHTSKVWLAVLALPVLLIGLIFFVPDAREPIVPGASGRKENERAETQSKRSPGEPVSPKKHAEVKVRDPGPIGVARNPECAATRHEQDGVKVVAELDGTRRIMARRSVVQPDALQRIEAGIIAEERAKADLVSYARDHTRRERETEVVPGSPKLREMIRSVAEGDLSGVRTMQSCYEDGVAWVKLEMTAP